MFIWSRWVDSVSPLVSLGSSGVVRFTRVRPGCLWVHPGSLDLFGFAIGVVWFTLVRHWSRWVHPRSLGSLWCALGVVEFMRGR